MTNKTPQPPNIEGEDTIREGLCQRCNTEYPVWYAPNELWNEVMRRPDGKESSEKMSFVCLNCFAKMADLFSEKSPSVWILNTKKNQATIEREARIDELRDLIGYEDDDWHGRIEMSNQTIVKRIKELESTLNQPEEGEK